MAQREKGLYGILSMAWAYRLSQRLIGSRRVWTRMVEEFIRPEPRLRILDLGCGTADLLEHLPDYVEYHGCDLSQRYVDDARQRYGARGVFHQADLGRDGLSALAGNPEPFDLAVLTGVLHHLDENQAAHALAGARAGLKTGGRLLCVDPLFTTPQHPIARWLAKRDRGQHVRDQDGYAALLAPHFTPTRFTILTGHLRLPYTTLVLEATTRDAAGDS